MTFSVDYNTALISKDEITAMVDDWVNITRRCYL